MAVTVEQFIERLTQSGLMSAAEISAFHDSLPPDQRPRDVQALVTVLYRAGKITKYQAKAVYEGKAQSLVFDEYVVLDKIGEGGMGVVLKAQHRRMDRVVAVKFLPDTAMKSPGAIERFYREVKAAAKLMHPNIVTAYDARQQGSLHCLIMEYVEGHDLATVVKEHGPLPVSQAVECVLQAARGLQYAHEQGIVHRDIKPGNLLLSKSGAVKILDMGLARITGTEAAMGGPERLTATGQVMGTCDYMAPEQAFDSRTADHRADIYALGCTLYRLLTGEPPYRGESLMQILLAHREAPIPSLCQARPDVPAELDSLFQKMVAKQPEDRQQSMAEVVAELEAILGVSSGRSAPRTPEEPSSSALAQSLAFLQEDRQNVSGTLRVPPAKTGTRSVPATLGSGSALSQRDTGSNVLSKALGTVAIVRRKPLVLLGLVGGLVLLLEIVLTLTLRHGTLVVEIDENLGKDVQVAVSQGGEKVQVADAMCGWTLSLAPGNYELAVQGGDDQFLLDSRTITVTRGGQVKVKVTLKPPPLAVAPFDAKQARKHQEAWARYLGVPKETTNAIGMKLVLIPPGEFTMGEGGEAHRVTITKPFYLGKYEVTQEEWEQVMLGSLSSFKGPTNPVENVTWNDCQDFLKKLGEKCGLPQGSYRLPTEAQWEYACRAGSTSLWFFGDSELGLNEYGWYKDNSEQKTHPVGGKKPNAWGLFDMHGNVWEWCADWFGQDYYKASLGSDPMGPPSGSRRVYRGGSWSNGGGGCRSADRCGDEPDRRGTYLGLRVLQVLADKPDGRQKVPDTESSLPAAQTPAVAPTALPAVKSLIGTDGKWHLPPGAPPPAVAPFDAAKAKEHQAGWAKHLGVPVEITNSIGMKLVLIPPGEFQMGSPKELIEEELEAHGDDPWYKDHLPSEGPQHRVRITKAFYLGIYGVTQAEYQRVMGTNPSDFSATGNSRGRMAGQGTDRFPVESVSWNEAVEFCRKLSEVPEEKAAGRTYRLPSEAQWEYACRAGSTGQYGFESPPRPDAEDGTFSECGWFKDNSDGAPHAIGGKRPGAWGLYDMHGNVWEWCQDWYDKEYYAKSPVDDPGGPGVGSGRVSRGGGWNIPAWRCRPASRGSNEPGAHDHALGFRVSLVLPDK